ncbi:hypothetical protein AOLI_G00145150 [Acnodon oligacanthus]
MERGVSSSKKNRILSKALRMSHSCQQRGPAEWTEDDFLRDSGDGVTEPALLSDDQLSQTLHCARPPPGPPQLPLPPFRLC